MPLTSDEPSPTRGIWGFTPKTHGIVWSSPCDSEPDRVGRKLAPFLPEPCACHRQSLGSGWSSGLNGARDLLKEAEACWYSGTHPALFSSIAAFQSVQPLAHETAPYATLEA